MSDEFLLQIYIARHGESWGNVRFAKGEEPVYKTRAEKLDPELTPLGVEQAALLGKRLGGLSFDAIFASSLIRAVSTAHEVWARQPQGAPQIEVLRDLVENGTPWDYAGYPPEVIKERYPHVKGVEFLGLDEDEWARFELEDPQASRLERARLCINYFRDRFQKGENIFIAAHGGFNTYLTRAALGLTNENGFNFCQENTGLTKIKYFTDGRLRLSYSNDTSHLYELMPGITYTL
ncbi:MAG: histidine phosphatase family protein [Clostridiales bacterium]|nr:histidine phosphatase family protein [Clostridiales bacterium]